MHQYFVLYKPFGVLSQFTREAPQHRVLGDVYNFPKDVYPVGRLDQDSEGLLLLTNDGSLNKRLLDPKHNHQRTYWVQVEGLPDENAIQQLAKGVSIRINKKNYQTLPAKASLLDSPPGLPERDPPIRFRKNVPDSWLELSLTEGKNRQVRKMCAAVGYPVLRLVRASIEKLELGDMQVGEVRELEKKELLNRLRL
jgi:23S rRNA pseudouridine2457 synthase